MANSSNKKLVPEAMTALDKLMETFQLETLVK